MADATTGVTQQAAARQEAGADLTLTSVTKSFGSFTAVDDLDLVVEQGRFFALLDQQVEVVHRGEGAEPLGDRGEREVGSRLLPGGCLLGCACGHVGHLGQAPITAANCFW